jgi:hypothetical protein
MIVIYRHWILASLCATGAADEPIPRAVIVRQEISQREFPVCLISFHVRPCPTKSAESLSQGLQWRTISRCSRETHFVYAQKHVAC